MNTFSDHFSGIAKHYQQFRPEYPMQLYDVILRHCNELNIALDVGAGTGQATRELAKHFQQVWAIDPSQTQCEQLASIPEVKSWVASAEAMGVESQSVDLITVAQAAHWFDLEAFYKECRRVLKPDGLLAIWCYGPAVLEHPANAVLQTFYSETLAEYWPPERQWVDRLYEGLPFPLKAIETPALTIRYQWNLERLLGYVATWSARRRYQQQTQKDPIQELKNMLDQYHLENVDVDVCWSIGLKLGRFQ